MFLRDNSGQAQILAVMTLGMVMTTASLYTLQYAEIATRNSIKRSQISSMKTALEGAVHVVERIYHQDAACDPVILTEKLSLLNPDGSLRAFSEGATRRQVQIPVGDDVYTVSIGSLQTLPLTSGVLTDWIRGYSQDAVLELWTSRGPTRVLQRAVLINNCTYPCAYTDVAATNICQFAWDPVHSYHRMLPAGLLTPALAGINQFNVATAGNLLTADVQDLVTLRNFLRSGEPAGFPVGQYDVNGDRKTDLTDLGILEKFMRGYLSAIPTRCGITSGCAGTVVD